ncbi:hypothetical protein [Actinomadura roseirufa]|uniref:hypothetical protein n=1 Tax=Actinomadura roseirufa TaxID=2094049 RepID=UPI001F5F815D|nr:hypothetical protein [Actinomadura roseirufa]
MTKSVPGRAPAPTLTDPCAEREPAGGRLFMDMIFTGPPGPPPPGTEIVTDGLGSAPGGVAHIAAAMSRPGLRGGLRAGLATPFGEAGEVPGSVPADCAFVIPFIPDAADDAVVWARPTPRER